MVKVRVENFGGVFDCRAGRWHDESARPIVWFLSEEQRRLAVHGAELPDQIVVRAAEGSGKTRGVTAPWTALRVLEFAGCHVELGGVAPTLRRLETLRIALTERMPAHWYSWRQRDSLFRFHLGVQLRLVSAHRASEAEGSPVQGYDWVGFAGDEVQDMTHIVDDVQARGRRAPGGRYRGVYSFSVKDTAASRDFLAKWKAAPKVRTIEPLTAFSNPFTSPEFWIKQRETLDSRAYRRRVLAEEVGPERMTYPEFERGTPSQPRNLIPLPRTLRDVTHSAVGVYESYIRPGAVFRLACGHDPGKIKNTTTLQRAYLFPGRVLTWLTVGEFITERTTQERHAAELRRFLQREYGYEQKPDRLDDEAGIEKVVIFRDPHSRGEQHPDDDVEGAFRRNHFDIFTAAPDKQVIKRRSRIEMMCRLIRSDSGVHRYGVACDDRGNPLAPETLKSFEYQERDELENPETLKKGENDITHPAVSVGYQLWPFEREETSAWTLERVLRAEGAR